MSKIQKHLFDFFKIPESIRPVMEFVDVQFAHKDGSMPAFGTAEQWATWLGADRLSNWRLVLPIPKLPGQRVEIPLHDTIPLPGQTEEEYWRAILGAAADFQARATAGEIPVPFDFGE